MLAVFMFFVLLRVLGVDDPLRPGDRAASAAIVGWVADQVPRRRRLGPRRAGRRVPQRDPSARCATPGSGRVPAAAANQLFDFLALEASLLAVGASVDPLLVLLAYVAAATLVDDPDHARRPRLRGGGPRRRAHAGRRVARRGRARARCSTASSRTGSRCRSGSARRSGSPAATGPRHDGRDAALIDSGRRPAASSRVRTSSGIGVDSWVDGLTLT